MSQESSFQYFKYGQKSNKSSEQIQNDLFNMNPSIHNDVIHFQQHLKQIYHCYFKDVQQQVNSIINITINDSQARSQHKLVLLNQNKQISGLISFEKPSIYIIGHLYGGVIIKYQVIIGNYKLSMDLLNLNFNGPQGLQEIGKGGYGKILKVSINDQQTFVAKRIMFHQKYKIRISSNQFILPNKFEINDVICQYAIYKICSFYKIGPRIVNRFGFDFVCFENCIEFYIEYCNKIILLHLDNQKQLKVAVRLLHKLKIIHKDIKPQNLLYSHEYDRLVLCDFGISHSVLEKQGQVTKTYKQGSTKYMCPEMQKMKTGQQHQIDLYYNDLYGLESSLIQLKQCSKNIIKNVSLAQPQQRKANIIYTSINFFYHLINNNTLESRRLINKFGNIIAQVQGFGKLLMNEEIKNIIESDKQIKQRFNKILSFDKNITNQNYKIINLIRCYGLTELLYDQLLLLPKTQFIQKIQFKISLSKASNDFTQWHNLQRLKKITPLKMKLRREIQILEEHTNGIESDILLKLYFELIYIILSKQKYINNQCIQLKNKILGSYKVRAPDAQYELLMLIVDIFTDNRTIYKHHEKAIDKFINTYPKSEVVLYEKIIQFCDNKYMIAYNLKLLTIYKQHKSIQKAKICQILNKVVWYYRENKQWGIYNLYLKQFEQIIHHVKDQCKKQEQIKLYSWLGNIETFKNNYHKAIQYYKKCEQTERLFNGEISLNRAQILLYIGQKYLKLNDCQSSLQYLKKSLQLYKLYSHEIEENKKIMTCYCYICINYLIEKDSRLFQKYFDLLVYDNQIQNPHEIAHNSEIELKQSLKKVLNQINISIKNNKKISSESQTQYYFIFKDGFIILKKKLMIIKFLQNQQNKIDLKQLNKNIDQLRQSLMILIQFIMAYRFSMKVEDNQNNLNQYLKFEQYYETIHFNKKLALTLYDLISLEYYKIHEPQLAYIYLKKEFLIRKELQILNSMKLFVRLFNITSSIHKYYQSIYFARICLINIPNKQQHSRLYISLITSYFYLHQVKETKKYQFEYIKHYIPRQISPYQSLMKLFLYLNEKDNLMIIRCYLSELMSGKCHSSNNVKIKQNITSNYQICRTVLRNEELKKQQQILKALKIIKRCLLIKHKINSLKYLKKKNLKNLIKKWTCFLN